MRGFSLAELIVGSFVALMSLAIMTMLTASILRGVRRGVEEGGLQQAMVTATAVLLADIAQCNSAGITTNDPSWLLGLQRQVDATDEHQPVFEKALIVYRCEPDEGILRRRTVLEPELTFSRLEPVRPDLATLATGSGARRLAAQVAEFSVRSPAVEPPRVGSSLNVKLVMEETTEKKRFSVERTVVLRASL